MRNGRDDVSAARSKTSSAGHGHTGVPARASRLAKATRRPATVVALLALALSALLGAPAGQAGTQSSGTTILVKFHAGVDAEQAVSANGDDATATTKTRVVVVELKDGESVGDGLAAYGATPGVSYAEPNDVYTAAALPAPSDPQFASQWALDKIHALDAWAAYPGSYTASSGARVAVVDSGVAPIADFSAGRLLAAEGANCLSGTCVAGSSGDDFGHGTEVAGALAASADDGTGIAGAAFASPVLPVKVLDAQGSGTAASIASGVIWAADHGARVVNLSLAGPYSQTICDAVAYATSVGALVVAAAGNNGTWVATYPAACPGAIGVAATDVNDATPFWSNYGNPNVFVSAPGVGILAPGLDGTPALVDGTSIAAPYVSALAALLFSQTPTRDAATVKTILAETSAKAGTGVYGTDPYGLCASCSWNGTYGYGRIDAAAALAWSGPQFSLATTSTPSGSIAPGASAAYGLSVAIDSGHSGPVTLSVAGLPAGATATFAPASLSASGTSQLTVATSALTPPGTYPLTISGTDAQTTHSVTASLVVAVSDFTLGASPSEATVGTGKSTAVSVAVARTGSYAGTVRLSASGLPTGATAAFSPSSVAAPGSSQLTLTAGTSTPAGTYTVTLTGTDGTRTRTTTLALTVVVPDFSVTATPATASVTQGASATFTTAVAFVGGYTGKIALTASGLPTNATGTFSATSLTAPGTPTLTVKTATTTPGGVYTITITGTSATKVVRTSKVTLTVIAPDFAVSSSVGSASLLQGQSAVYPVVVDVVNGFTGSIALTASGAPTGATVSFAPSSVAAPGSSSLTIKTAATTAPGTYAVTITGTSAARVVRTAKVTLVVNPAGDFAIAPLAPSVTVKHGSFVQTSLTLTGAGGFAATVGLTVTGPTGLTATLGKTSLAVSGTTPLSVTLKLAAATSMAPGTYTVTLTGTCGGIVHAAPLTLVVT